MRKPFKWSVLLAVLLFGLTLMGGTGVGAQDEAEFSPADLEGLQHGVSRGYSIDYTAMMEEMMSTPDAELTMPSGLIGLNAMVLEFDNDDNAEKGQDTLVAQFESEDDFMGEDVEEWDIDLGNKSKSLAGTEETEGIESHIAITVVQEGNYIYIVSAYGSDVDVQDLTRNLTEKMIDNDGSGEGEFVEDGTSTGGLWDKFPAADDDLVAGLMTFDMIVFPEPEDAEA